MDIVLIAAVAENGVIGVDGELPWHYSEDLKHFKDTTEGHPVIAGRVTHEGIVEQLGTPLPDRETLVLTQSGVSPHEDVTEVASVNEALTAASTLDDVVFVIGGASVYEQFMEDADRLVITEIPEQPDGDAYFPEWSSGAWEQTDIRSGADVTFVTYEKI